MHSKPIEFDGLNTQAGFVANTKQLKATSLNAKWIGNRIFSIRGLQVMLDSDLAELYQVETKVLNQAVKRNMERFPIAFRFQLTTEELGAFALSESSRSQIVTLNKTNRGLNYKYLPYAFTEQGVAMLSAVLRSDVAVQVSISIMSAFVEMRSMVRGSVHLLKRMDLAAVDIIKAAGEV